MMEKRHREEATEKEHKEGEERRRVAAYREERKKKLERARRAKTTMEENPCRCGTHGIHRQEERRSSLIRIPPM